MIRSLTVNNKRIHWKSWKNAGILYINDIINPSNEFFLSPEILQKKSTYKSNTLKHYKSNQVYVKTLKQNTYSTSISNIQNSILINTSKREIVESKCKDYH